MGTPAEHQVKAAHNLAFLATIPDQYPDWLTTVAFYCAVHLIEQLLGERGLHCADHYQRKQAVQRNFPAIQKAYNALYNASLVARYESPNDVLPIQEVRLVLIDRHLKSVLQFIRARTTPGSP